MSNPNGADNPKVVTQRVSVHVVSYTCPNCNNEKEHIEFCEKCGKEMKVVDVVEKFGTEAQELIEKLKNVITSKSKESNDEESPNIIIISENDEDILNGGDDDENTITDSEVAELDELDEIFSEGEEDTHVVNEDDSVRSNEDIGGLLDQEEDDQSLDDLDLDPDDLPTL